MIQMCEVCIPLGTKKKRIYISLLLIPTSFFTWLNMANVCKTPAHNCVSLVRSYLYWDLFVWPHSHGYRLQVGAWWNCLVYNQVNCWSGIKVFDLKYLKKKLVRLHSQLLFRVLGLWPAAVMSAQVWETTYTLKLVPRHRERKPGSSAQRWAPTQGLCAWSSPIS